MPEVWRPWSNLHPQRSCFSMSVQRMYLQSGWWQTPEMCQRLTCFQCESVMQMRANALIRRFRNRQPQQKNALLKKIRSKNGNTRLRIIPHTELVRGEYREDENIEITLTIDDQWDWHKQKVAAEQQPEGSLMVTYNDRVAHVDHCSSPDYSVCSVASSSSSSSRASPECVSPSSTGTQISPQMLEYLNSALQTLQTANILQQLMQPVNNKTWQTFK